MRIRGKSNVQIEYSIRYFTSPHSLTFTFMILLCRYLHNGTYPVASQKRWMRIQTLETQTDVFQGDLPFGAPAWLQLRVSNINAHWLHQVEAVVQPLEIKTGPALRPAVKILPPDVHRHPFASLLPPLHTEYFPLSFTLDHSPNGGSKVWPVGYYDLPVNERQPCLSFNVYLRAQLRNGDELVSVQSNVIKVSLRCRFAGQSFLFSFPDHDGSITLAGNEYGFFVVVM
jgi:hypothetical protein